MYRGVGNLPAANAHCQYLRHELPRIARAQLGLRISLLHYADGGVLGSRIVVLPAKKMAVVTVNGICFCSLKYLINLTKNY